MNTNYAYLVLLAVLPLASAQQRQPDLTGTVSFDVSSESGRAERIAVMVGDGGAGPFKAILAGDPSLPTHTIYRPRDLSPFGDHNLLPIVAFGNGGCRNSSGEFRNFLSEIASHGYLVIAIGPAGNAAVSGSEGNVWQTRSSQLLDGVDWAIKQNSTEGSEYRGKVDISKVAVMGQSCGTRQAMDVSTDPRVTTTLLMNGGFGSAPTPTVPPPASSTAAPPEGRGAYGGSASSTAGILSAIDRMQMRYAPYAPATPPMPMPMPTNSSQPVVYHGPVAFIDGGPADLAYAGAQSGYQELKNQVALFAFQDVGHYPATYRQPHGGAFAIAAISWLDWQLKGQQSGRGMFVGPECGLCKDIMWHVQIKNLQ